MVTLLQRRLDRGLSVAIGTEHGFEPLASCAVVVAPVSVEVATPAPSACSARPGCTTRRRWPPPTSWASVSASAWPTRPEEDDVAAADQMPDLYGLLGVRRDATDDEIKRAYRQKARELHPDTNSGDPEAEAKFKEVTLAYEVLRDPERRARYDRYGPEGVFGQGAGRGRDPSTSRAGWATSSRRSSVRWGDVQPRQAPRPAARLRRRGGLQLSFAEAAFGVQQGPLGPPPGHLRRPARAREPGQGPSPSRCPDCQGTGEIRRIRQSLLGQVVTSVACGRCQGLGEIIPTPCPMCRGEGAGRRTSDLHRRGAGRRRGRAPRCAWRTEVRPARGAAATARSSSTWRSSPTTASSGRATTCTPPPHVAMAQAALGSRSQVETLEDPAGPAHRAGHPERPRRAAARGPGSRTSVDVAAATSSSTSWSTPHRASPPARSSCSAQLAAERGEDGRRRPGGDGVLSRLRSAFG